MSIICAVSGAISLGLAAVLTSPFGRAMVVRNTRGGRTLLRCLVALFVLDASVNLVAAATGADGVMTIAAVSTLMVSLSAALLILGSRRISPAAPIAPRRFLVVIT